MFANVFNRVVNGWAIGREALTLLGQHPKLLVFPALSGVAFVGILAIIVAPLFGLALMPKALLRSLTLSADAAFWLTAAWVFAGYTALWFITTFFNTALCATVLAYHVTGRVSLREGFSIALGRLPQILAWAAFAATVGVLLSMLSRALENALGLLGRVFGVVFEAAWAVAVFFVAPVLAVEGVGPLAVLSRSTEIIYGQWGKVVGAQLSVTWALWPLHLVGIGLFWALRETRGAAPTDLGSALALAFVAYVLIAQVLHGLISGIARSNLYLYAATGDLPRGADAVVYAAMFRK
jgi:Family of unknown function (DUF6159)